MPSRHLATDRESALYRGNLAYVHHRGFQEFSRSAAPVLLRMLRQRGITSGHVVDLGCGDGTWLRELTAAGYSATGFEQSPHFVMLARIAAPDARVVRASLFEDVLPPCDAITALGEVFNYLSAPRRATDLAVSFRRAYAALRPGGVLLFDMLVAGRPTMQYEHARVAEDWAVFVRVTEAPGRGRLTRQIVAFRELGGRYTREDETHTLRVPSRSKVLSDLRQVGFAAQARAGYDEISLAPRRVAFVATKLSQRDPKHGYTK